MEKRTYKGVDILKLFFALCVFYLHAPLYAGEFYQIYAKPIICRLAVPYFFVASGYFYGKKLYTSVDQIATIQRNYTVRLLEKLIFFEPFSIVYFFIDFLIDGKSIAFSVRRSVQNILFYPRGALWYIQAVIVAILLLGILIKRQKEKWIIPVGIPLYMFALIANRYHFLVEGHSLEKLIRVYRTIFLSERNGLFWGFLFVGIGILLSRKQQFIDTHKKPLTVLFWLSLACYIGEVILIKDYPGAGDQGLFITHLAIVPLLFIVSTYIQIPSNIETKLARDLSVSIYLLHSPVMNYLSLILTTIFGITFPAWVHSIMTLTVVLAISAIAFRSKSQFIRRLLS